MLIILIIMSGLALLAATVCIFLLIQEKKRSQKRNTAMADYTDAAIAEAKQSIAFDLNETIHAYCNEIMARVERLEKGVVPDFEEAKQAARAVDDFNKGLSNILGFDPMASLQKEREKAQYGGETD